MYFLVVLIFIHVCGMDSVINNNSLSSLYPEDEVCIICGFGEDYDEDEELWVEWVRCLNWTHVRCLPEEYPFHYADPDFPCPICYCQCLLS